MKWYIRLIAVLSIIILPAVGLAGSTKDKEVFLGPVIAKSTVDLSGAVLQGASPLVFEGATNNAYETTFAITDPTADRTITFPNSSGTVALNPYGESIEFEGATADDYETTLAVADPTADRTVTIPDATGSVKLNATATHNYSAGHAAWTLSTNESYASFVTVSNADQAVTAQITTVIPGQCYFIYNGSGFVLTFKVTGQTGGTIANGKYGFYCSNATDVVEVWEQS